MSVLVSATKDLLNIMVLVGSSDLKGNMDDDNNHFCSLNDVIMMMVV